MLAGSDVLGQLLRGLALLRHRCQIVAPVGQGLLKRGLVVQQLLLAGSDVLGQLLRGLAILRHRCQIVAPVGQGLLKCGLVRLMVGLNLLDLLFGLFDLGIGLFQFLAPLDKVAG